MQALELLSPAKNLECGISAIDHGADAVYIGADKYGARAAAGNSIEDIHALCNHAHIYGAKVYVTVNTIIYDNELNDTIELCKQLEKAGVDALLLQDMGLASCLRSHNCNVNIHASTQTDNRTKEKVQWLASLGFKRIVLARELSVSEIAEIHRFVPEAELEVFVHGALCVSYSGQCYASQHCFSRSANRGECAQFCRLPFTMKDADGNILEDSRHLLSLKDMAQLENMERLADAGAVSFKIEGRLKDADYVKNVTAAYSERLNDICRKHPDRYCRASFGKCTYTFSPDINKSFNRGFTTYFADGRQKALISPDTPKAIGEYVGRVKEIKGNSFNVASTVSFNNGDGLCFFNKSHQLVGFRVNRAENNRLFPQQMPRDLRPNMALYRNHDHAFQMLLDKSSVERKLPISMTLHVGVDTLTLKITDERQHDITATLPFSWQEAEKPQEDNIRHQLMKLGGTPYTCNKLDIACDKTLPFIQNSILARLRREAIEQKLAADSEVSSNTLRSPAAGIAAPRYDNPACSFLYNAANAKAREFYRQQGISATSFEQDSDNSPHPVMQCRYCIKYEMGFCTKEGKRLPWKEPLILSLDDGREFNVSFNCKQCQMEIWTR